MQDKIDWMLTELNEDGYYPTEQALRRVLEGNAPEFFNDSILDYIDQLDGEWEGK